MKKRSPNAENLSGRKSKTQSSIKGVAKYRKCQRTRGWKGKRIQFKTGGGSGKLKHKQKRRIGSNLMKRPHHTEKISHSRKREEEERKRAWGVRNEIQRDVKEAGEVNS